MKRLLFAIAALFVSVSLFAQNDKGDNILGIYVCGTGKDAYKVKFVKLTDGNYRASICWVADPYEPDGSLSRDVKNPDKSLRDTPMDKVVLINGLKYNAAKQQWDGAKIYDPTRGIRVNVTVKFDDPKTLKVRGTVLGIGETAIWVREK
ncbi:MAG: DUF2147 domain-containing protein [Bacteroidales bacterium]|nr:DUF2147 domain-containing protein [Bacteroidales bacterium]